MESKEMKEGNSHHGSSEGNYVPTSSRKEEDLTPTSVQEWENQILKTDKIPVLQCGIEFWLSLRVLLHLTFTVETTVVLLLSLGSACLFIFYRNQNGDILAARLDFNLMSIALVFPVTFLIQTGFQRRERALSSLASLKSDFAQFLLGSMVWNSHKDEFSLENTEEIYSTLVHIVKNMKEALSLPTSSRRRHFYTRKGIKFREKVLARVKYLGEDIQRRFLVLHLKVNRMKRNGLPGGEASRLEQYLLFLQEKYEQLLAIKNFRTPQGARSFLRIFIVVIPVLLGPYYAWVYEQAGLVVALVLAFFTSYVVIALIYLHRNLEDPFVFSYVDDGPEITEEFDHICSCLLFVKTNASALIPSLVTAENGTPNQS